MEGIVSLASTAQATEHAKAMAHVKATASAIVIRAIQEKTATHAIMASMKRSRTRASCCARIAMYRVSTAAQVPAPRTATSAGPVGSTRTKRDATTLTSAPRATLVPTRTLSASTAKAPTRVSRATNHAKAVMVTGLICASNVPTISSCVTEFALVSEFRYVIALCLCFSCKHSIGVNRIKIKVLESQ